MRTRIFYAFRLTDSFPAFFYKADPVGRKLANRSDYREGGDLDVPGAFQGIEEDDQEIEAVQSNGYFEEQRRYQRQKGSGNKPGEK